MQTRLDEHDKVHVSHMQLEAIKKALEEHDNNYNLVDADSKEMMQIVNGVKKKFVQALMDELMIACSVQEDKKIFEYGSKDDSYMQNNNESFERVEPYDFALTDRLRNVHQNYEEMIAKSCHLARTVPPIIGDINSKDLDLCITEIDHIVQGCLERTNDIFNLIDTEIEEEMSTKKENQLNLVDARRSTQQSGLALESLDRLTCFL
jgi:small nuclear ribonucleoprotein (snRNP)-like protein